VSRVRVPFGRPYPVSVAEAVDGGGGEARREGDDDRSFERHHGAVERRWLV
jgi:hypothetical protein